MKCGILLVISYMGKYDDIIDLPHHRSAFRTPMPMENRAAQFAPFAALSGHDDAISETSRLTTERVELSDSEKEEISKIIREASSSRKKVSITYFIPDKVKAGGSYATTSGRIVKIEEIDHLIILDHGLSLPLENILSISPVTPS